MMEAPDSSKTSVLTRATRRNIQENTILHSHRRENLNTMTAACIDGLTRAEFGGFDLNMAPHLC
jgi:hypothetical protein